MKRIIPILLLLAPSSALLASGPSGNSTNKVFMVQTNNVLNTDNTNFFTTNIFPLTNALAAAGFGSGGGGASPNFTANFDTNAGKLDLATSINPTNVNVQLNLTVNSNAVIAKTNFSNWLVNTNGLSSDGGTMWSDGGGDLTLGTIYMNGTGSILFMHGGIDQFNETENAFNGGDWADNGRGSLTASNMTANGSITARTNITATLQLSSSNIFNLDPNGWSNSFFGFPCGPVAVAAGTNLAFGDYTLTANTSGSDNVAIGVGALAANTTGYQNIGIGFLALAANTSGYGNTAIGAANSQYQNNGYQNTSVGFQSQEKGGGQDNSSEGAYDLADNAGSRNTGVGDYALYGNNSSSSWYNVAVGFQALYSVNNGVTLASNTAVGAATLWNLSSGLPSFGNIALGFEAGSNLVNGSSNIYIGHPGNANETNVIHIGTTQTNTYLAGVLTVASNEVAQTNSGNYLVSSNGASMGGGNCIVDALGDLTIGGGDGFKVNESTGAFQADGNAGTPISSDGSGDLTANSFLSVSTSTFQSAVRVQGNLGAATLIVTNGALFSGPVTNATNVNFFRGTNEINTTSNYFTGPGTNWLVYTNFIGTANAASGFLKIVITGWDRTNSTFAYYNETAEFYWTNGAGGAGIIKTNYTTTATTVGSWATANLAAGANGAAGIGVIVPHIASDSIWWVADITSTTP